MKHGHTRKGWASPTYRSWQHMRDRCRNPNAKDRANYADRGIAICARWGKFENFLADMGVKPEGLTLERKDNNKGYSPDNCVWAARTAQNRNRRYCKLTMVTARKIRASPAKQRVLAERYGVSQTTISAVKTNKVWVE